MCDCRRVVLWMVLPSGAEVRKCEACGQFYRRTCVMSDGSGADIWMLEPEAVDKGPLNLVRYEK